MAKRAPQILAAALIGSLQNAVNLHSKVSQRQPSGGRTILRPDLENEDKFFVARQKWSRLKLCTSSVSLK